MSVVYVRILFFILLLGILGAAFIYFFVLDPNEPHPEAPELTFITDQRNADGLAMYHHNATVELTAKQTGQIVVQLVNDESYQRRLRGKYPLGRQGEGILLDARTGRFIIPRALFERSGEGKYWVRAGALCGERQYQPVMAMFPIHIDERTGYMMVPTDGRANHYKAYCIGEFFPFIWKRGSQEAESDDIRWVLSGTVLKAGVFEFPLPVSFEPISIIQTVKDTISNSVEFKKSKARFKYMYVYESLPLHTMLIFYGSQVSQALDDEVLKKTAEARIKLGTERKQMDERSRVVTGIEIDGKSAVLTDIYYQQGQGQMQIFDVLLSDKAHVKHTIAIIQEGMQRLAEQNISDFLAAIQLQANTIE